MADSNPPTIRRQFTGEECGGAFWRLHSRRKTAKCVEDVNAMTAARGRVAPIRPAAGSLLSFGPPNHQWLVGPPPPEPSPSDQVWSVCLSLSPVPLPVCRIVSGQNRPRPRGRHFFLRAAAASAYSRDLEASPDRDKTLTRTH